MGAGGEEWHHRRCNPPMECPMPQPRDDLSRSLVALDQNKTLIAVVELS